MSLARDHLWALQETIARAREASQAEPTSSPNIRLAADILTGARARPAVRPGGREGAGAGFEVESNKVTTPFLPNGVRVHQTAKEAETVNKNLPAFVSGLAIAGGAYLAAQSNPIAGLAVAGGGLFLATRKKEPDPDAIGSALRLHSRLKQEG